MDDNLPKEIDFEQYKDTPSSLFSIASTFFSKGEYESGIAILEQAIHFAITKYGKEDSIEVARYYNKYAEGLIRKLLENQEILEIPEDEPQKGEMPSQRVDLNNIEDEQIAYDNLRAAEEIYLKYLSKYDKVININNLDKKVIQHYLDLADVYMNFAELDQTNSNFESANERFIQGIQLRKKYDVKFSRSLAELYFKQATALEKDSKGELLCYYKTLIIMQYHLNEKIKEKALSIELVIDESDLDLESIDENSNKIYQNKKNMELPELKALAKENEDVNDLLEIIDELYLKIEDVIIVIKQQPEFEKEKEKMNKEAQDGQENVFTQGYDKDNVVDISTTLIKKKRKRSEDTKNKEDQK